MRLINCTYKKHAVEILDILNEAIEHSTALYDYKPRAIDSMVSWFKTKEQGCYPVIGAVDGQNKLMGFASYGSFRNWPAYKYSVEHAVYVHKDHRRKGVAKFLMQKLLDEAKAQNYHVVIGGIDETNTASVSMHVKLGFTHCGTIQQAGYKFGRWLDLAFYQLVLDTPEIPNED
ncbi:MAG: GNAT family N-acetyltransferase [Gammaproteobacteria bacterium]|nr:GNAT family N-acetyltransferase [Gammaproteobacteria bacterium]MDH5728809.1 GNAT family N-acetyltransferase [Gammaproteobacteria bacterium]